MSNTATDVAYVPSQAGREGEAMIERLKPLCDENALRMQMTEPFEYQRNGLRYVALTDGHFAVMLESQESAIKSPVDFDVIFNQYHPSTGNSFNVPFKSLVDFAGEAVFDHKGGLAKCWKCDGQGSCWHCDEDCRECDGTGDSGEAEIVTAPVRACLLSNVAVNGNLLAKALSMVIPCRNCEVTLPEGYTGVYSSKQPPVFLRGPDWWIISMPLTKPENTELPALNLATC